MCELSKLLVLKLLDISFEKAAIPGLLWLVKANQIEFFFKFLPN